MNKSKTAETRTGAMSNYGWSTGTSSYDDEDRLVSWTRDDNNLSQSWTLTNEGDWSQFVENTTTENRTHGPAHELTAIGSTALSYDPKGNLTVDNTKNHNYTWDFDNRMSAADTDGDNTDDVTLKYDALGRRIAKAAGTNAVVYVSMTQPIQYSPFAGQVVAEYASGAAPASPTQRYVYASYIDEPVLKDGTGGTVYYHRNSQYSVSALTSASGAVFERYGYEPYGELTILAADGSTVRASSSYANSYTYTGRRWDAELKLYYFRARYYDPALGRFVGRDPLDILVSNNVYQSLVGFNSTDPSGNRPAPISAPPLQSPLLVVGKSFINGVNPIGSISPPGPPGVPTPPTWLPIPMQLIDSGINSIAATNYRLQLLAEWVGRLEAFNENPRTDARDGRYRLYGAVEIDAMCIGFGGNTVALAGVFVDTDGGREIPLGPIAGGAAGAIGLPSIPGAGPESGTRGFGIYGTVNLSHPRRPDLPGPLVVFQSRSSLNVSWMTWGRPNLLVEPGMQWVRVRTSVHIWHIVSIRATCRAGSLSYSLMMFTGSRFPSHRLWIDGRPVASLRQGTFADLWNPAWWDDSFVQ